MNTITECIDTLESMTEFDRSEIERIIKALEGVKQSVRETKIDADNIVNSMHTII